jgi:hypothetical protein
MATNTYVALATQTLGTAASSVTFSSIPQGYTDLRLVIAGTGTTPYYAYVYFNGDTGSNYSRTELYGNGTSAASFRGSNSICVATDATQNNMTLDVMNYSNATTFKTFLYRQSRTTDSALSGVALWRSTSAITSISITGYLATTFATGSTFTIYGIAAAGAPIAKATGGTITYDVGYTYHTFTSSGTFTPLQSLSADILTIAGGGGGGGEFAGGGGAGGLLYTSGASLTATGYTVTVGAGGTGTISSQPGNGNNSEFSAYTAIGGGSGGANSNTYPARTGGSGGGGSRGNAGAAGTSGQGFAGGTAVDTMGAGGGGAGAVGVNGSSNSVGTAGGVGSNAYSSWASITSTGVSGYYAGGGGGAGYAGVSGAGGAGGLGGGGNGGGTNSGLAAGVAGVSNTGGGGGGGSYIGGVGNYTGGNGGSGVVIIRYAN